mmetsp:Transcript_110056/g.276809  ORF Transcript_110056/g.276809 Transcript_110056/m.276809 type:complete len:154 (-) Transcript_110056:222-683(-)
MLAERTAWVVAAGVPMMVTGVVAYRSAKVRLGAMAIGIPVVVRMNRAKPEITPLDQMLGAVLAVGVPLQLNQMGAAGQHPVPMELVLAGVAALVPLSALHLITGKEVVLMAQVAVGVVIRAGRVTVILAKVAATTEVQVGTIGDFCWLRKLQM